ncbi:IS5 family transposase [Lacticaseibacillus paracasei]|uniref:IS5 family transposase n=1 Tax=Lacticaseibacillus paracasei TaxID=1597 RepID=UPI001CDBCCCB|nr:IS5 family transposase [Lacticaseibacillus paracasei]
MPDYPSNISRAQFALIQPDLENFRKHTRPRRYDLYDVFNAILYSLTTGCQWRELPHDFPEWHTVYRYYDMWRDKPDPTADSLLERPLKKTVASYRFAQGRSARTSFVIVDAQSVKTTDLTKNSGYDGGKKISGIKRHMAVDINGPVHSFTVDRGTEFSGLVSLESQYGIKTYYCHAHTPAERGSNERFNRNLRYFYPKGTRFEHISAQDLTTTLLQINQRPLKILDWQTPYQVMLTNLSKNSD